jgi:hypothetical protein
LLDERVVFYLDVRLQLFDFSHSDIHGLRIFLARILPSAHADVKLLLPLKVFVKTKLSIVLQVQIEEGLGIYGKQ